jgi:phage baseplate assembly protein W
VYSISFPKIFNDTKTLLIKNTEATASNLWLLLKSDKRALFGDPFFGTSLKRAIFEQNDGILVDLVIDEIYTSITTFMPQIKLHRENIKLTSDGVDVFCNITCTDLTDYTTNLYKINLTEETREVNNGVV